MLAAALLVLAGSGCNADLTGTLTVMDRNEVRLRTYEGEMQPAFDAVTTPGLLLDIVGERVTYSLSYSASLTLQDLELGLQPQVFQALSSRVSWLATRELRLSFAQEGSYGTYNYSTLSPTTSGSTSVAAGTPPPTIQLLPGSETILYGTSRSTASAQLRATHALTLTLTPSYFVGGGLDAASRAVAPLETVPRLALDVAYTTDRRDALITTLAVTDTEFSTVPCSPTAAATATTTSPATCMPHNDLAEASEAWRRRLTWVDDLAVSAGVTGSYAQGEAGGDGTHLFPTASATWVHNVRGEAETSGALDVDVRVAPVVDVRYGTVDQRVQARIAWTWKTQRTTLATDVGFTESLPPSEVSAVTFFGAGGEALYALDTRRRFEVGAGDRGAWQSQAPFPAFFTNVLYAVFVYREPADRLWP